MTNYTILRPFGDVGRDRVGGLIPVPDPNRAHLMINQRLIEPVAETVPAIEEVATAPKTGSEPRPRTSSRKKPKANRPKMGKEATK